ncbi:NUDIX domain-containing protein [Paraneptunicella aestuarii]|uniref:NUDIX domain-containing protein n=1 Tax=Paraneptunicella aestuarii TaxID=2831148 RepID=UPI001E584CD1|nr:NUDIX domain-containing protein [Paraneptunicella aestuarii]UAA38054.1 NUDIX domain-containing protein [Paraneptunicella aestuarii]
MCRINQDFYEDISSNAGCIVRVGDRILSLTNRKSSKFDIPGGNMIVGESAQCTAHRETWEETGFNVEVGEYLGTSPKGFRFYACELDDDFGGKVQKFPVPDWAQFEVVSIQLVDPFITSPKEWRFPDQVVQIRDMFNHIGSEEHKAHNTSNQ